ncbi:MAG: sulfur oxidation c-type cytochrome SoxA [Thiotrichaceae bacterium]|nr:sulfur oxidation c-type cytochrome SoxA [Thiotrichaceae bacterium]
MLAIHHLKMYFVLFVLSYFSGILNLVHATEFAATVQLEASKPAYNSPWARYATWEQKNWDKYTNTAKELPSPISPKQKLEIPIVGDVANGKKLIADRKLGGSCLACHLVPDEHLMGNVGIDLTEIGTWENDEERMFNHIYDSRIYNPNSVMPPWGAHGLISPTEIKDIVAYLKTLKSPVEFAEAVDNPANRPVPVETRNNLDPFENPAMASLELGEQLFQQQCSSCHQSAAKYKGWAVKMPKYAPSLQKVLGVEEFVTRHARATKQLNYVMQSKENLALAIYLRALSNGEAIAVDVKDAKTQAAFKRGETLMLRKQGQLNLACVDCHQTGANKWLRGQYLTTTKGMIDHFPTYRTSRGEIWDIRKRLQWCNVSVRANELPPDASEYAELELYLTAINNGQIMNVPGIRH